MFGYIDKWYTRKLETVRENEIHKNLWNIDTQTDHQFQETSWLTRKETLVIQRILQFQRTIE